MKAQTLEELTVSQHIDNFREKISTSLASKTTYGYSTDLTILLKGIEDMKLSTLVDYKTLASTVLRRIEEIKSNAGKEEGYAPKSVNRKISSANVFLSYLSGYCFEHLGEELKIPPLSQLRVVKQKDRVEITPEQFNRLLAGIPTTSVGDLRDRAIFSLMYAAGLDAIDIPNVKYSDFDRSEDGQITGFLAYVKCDSKTPDEIIRLPIDRATSDILREYEASLDKPVGNLNVPYFINMFGTSLSDRSVRRSFRCFADKAGLPEEIDIKSLRHGYLRGHIRLEGGIKMQPQTLDQILPEKVIVVNSMENLDGLTIDPNKIYWLKGTPESTGNSLAIFYETEVAGEIPEYGKGKPIHLKSEVVRHDIFREKAKGFLADVDFTNAYLRYGTVSLDKLSQLQLLEEIARMQLNSSVPSGWTLSAEAYEWLNHIINQAPNRDFKKLDIIIIGKDVDRNAARSLIGYNYLANQARDYADKAAKELGGA